MGNIEVPKIDADEIVAVSTLKGISAGILEAHGISPDMDPEAPVTLSKADIDDIMKDTVLKTRSVQNSQGGRH